MLVNCLIVSNDTMTKPKSLGCKQRWAALAKALKMGASARVQALKDKFFVSFLMLFISFCTARLRIRLSTLNLLQNRQLARLGELPDHNLLGFLRKSKTFASAHFSALFDGASALHSCARACAIRVALASGSASSAVFALASAPISACKQYLYREVSVV